MKLPRLLTPHTVTCRDKVGDSAYGPVHADEERTLKWVRVEDGNKLVRSGDGSEVVSSSRVVIRPEHAPVPVGSFITLPHGRIAEVLAVEWFHTPPAPEHYVLQLA